jgi:OmpA-OmpF porin, OOP family
MTVCRWIGPALAASLVLSSGCQTHQVPPPKVAAAPAAPADADGDGVPDDGTDRCLDEKEDGLAPKPQDGCKSSDADGDGIPDDGTDHCVGEKEDGLLPDPQDGCPSTDPDNDGIPNNRDRCPDQPETKNDFEDDDGCPDTAPRVRVTRSEVKITEKIMFAFGKATIEKQSDGLLDEIAIVLDANPQIEFIEVAGHADYIGTDGTNALLTRQRAQAVLQALAQRGIDRPRMRAAGYGRYCPVDPGESDAAREKNRRVEFKILRIDGVETGVALGCEEAAKKGIKPAGVPKSAMSRSDIEKAREKRGGLTLSSSATPSTTPPAPPAAVAHPPPAGKQPAKTPATPAPSSKPPAGKNPPKPPTKSTVKH